MTCQLPEWYIPAFLWIAVFSVILSLDVMQHTEHDEINVKDRVWIQLLRRGGFIFMASNLGSAMYFAWTSQGFWFLVFFFLVFVSGTYSLLINDIALRLRRVSPDRGTSSRSDDMNSRYSPDFIASTLRSLQEEVSRLNRGQTLTQEDIKRLDLGQLLTHLYLQSIFNNQGMEGEKAAVDSSSVIFPKQWQKP